MKKIVFALILSSALTGYSENIETTSPNVQYGECGGHKYVDLGLPSGTLWATCNLGSNFPYEPGMCFSWGETEPREFFQFYNYAFFEREETDENGKTIYILTDIGEDITGTQYDAATRLWGGGWRMPNKEECYELLMYCNTECKDGLRVEGPNGNRIFLPWTFCWNSTIMPAMLYGSYWSGSLDMDNSKIIPNNSAVALFFSNSELIYSNWERYNGMSIRPVISKKDVETSVGTIKKDRMAIRYDNGVIYVDDYADGCLVVISDISGRIISNSLIKDQKSHIDTLPQGIYILSLYKEGVVCQSQKLIIK